MSGLHLRTMTDFISPTVYCLILENSMVYCGTANNDLLVFRFHVGFYSLSIIINAVPVYSK